MLKNVLIMDESRWEHLNSHRFMLFLDVVIIVNEDGTYTIKKNRYEGPHSGSIVSLEQYENFIKFLMSII